MQRILFWTFLAVAGTLPGATANPIDTVLHRAEQYLRDMAPPADVDDMMAAVTREGAWPDIDYSDADPSGWDVSQHLQRLRAMSIAWTDPDSPRYRDTGLRQAIDRSLEHWLQKRYQNRNWWHNEIGIPRLMQDIIVVLRNDLNADQFAGAMAVLGQHRVRGTGANLVWSADLGLHYGALSRDEAMIRRCSDLISNEISITTDEGIQPDYSYHQHGPRLQTYHYGAAFLRENVKLAWELRGTPWEFSREKTDILSDFILRGWQWMARGIHTVPGTIDRAVSRNGNLRNADLRSLIPYLVALHPQYADQFTAILQSQNDGGTRLRGYRHFPYSDFSVYHHRDFSFFVKTISDRTRFSESINNENLKGRFLNTGDTYFVRDGDEYFDLMPAWDWEHLPGITSFRGAHAKQQAFTGGVGNGACGLTVMHHTAEDKGRRLSVRKFWAVYDNVMVCLMADLQTNSDTVYTVLDQARWRGDVSVDTPDRLLDAGKNRLKNVKWIYHSGFAYIPLTASSMEVRLTTNTGSWESINKSGAPTAVVEKVFMPLLYHSGSGNAAYVVASLHSAAGIKPLLKKPVWEIIRNEGACQSVRFADGTSMTAFLSAGNVTVGRRNELSVDRPCLVILSEKRIYVSDPTHEGGTVTMRLRDKQLTIDMPADGTTVAVDF